VFPNDISNNAHTHTHTHTHYMHYVSPYQVKANIQFKDRSWRNSAW